MHSNEIVYHFVASVVLERATVTLVIAMCSNLV